MATDGEVGTLRLGGGATAAGSVAVAAAAAGAESGPTDGLVALGTLGAH
jgi:hypothetical protein